MARLAIRSHTCAMFSFPLNISFLCSPAVFNRESSSFIKDLSNNGKQTHKGLEHSEAVWGHKNCILALKWACEL